MRTENFEQSNTAGISVDIEEHKKGKEIKEEIDEMEILRHEIYLIRGKVEEEKKRTHKNREGMNGCFLRGQELLEVNPKDLTEEDLKMYKNFKKAKVGKIEVEKFEEEFTDYTGRLIEQVNEKKLENNLQSDSYATSRLNFLAWIRIRWIYKRMTKDPKYAEKIKTLKLNNKLNNK